MEKQRKIKVLSVAALIVAVLGLTVAFAALSQTLTINGSANVDPGTWDIRLENIRDVYAYNDAKFTTEPVINNDVINFSVELTKPGDLAYFMFDIKNHGTIDAKVNKLIQYGIVTNITGPDEHGDYTYDMEEVTEELIEKIVPIADWDGDGETTMEEREKTLQILEVTFREKEFETSGNGYILNAGARSTYEFYISYSNSATELPKGDVVLNLEFGFGYTQK